MSCMNILSIVSNVNGTIIISGYASPGCPAGISLSVNCGGTIYTGTAPSPGGQADWQGVVLAPCNCDSAIISVTATCLSDPTCTQTINNIPICCCQSFSNTLVTGVCDSSGNQQFTFNTTITNLSTCDFLVQRDFGNSNMGPVYTSFAMTTMNISDSESYANGTYTSQMIVTTSPAATATGCVDNNPIQITAFCPPAPPCYPTALRKAICMFLEWLYLLSVSIAYVMIVFPPCFTLNEILIFAGIALLAILLFLLLKCDKCVCGWWQKFVGKMFIIVGIVSFMFVPPTSAINVNCFLSPFLAFVFATLFLTVGFGTLNTWYINNKVSCPLTICDFWCEVGGLNNIRSCTNISVFASIIIFSVLLGANPVGFGAALLVASFILSIAGYVLTHTTGCNNMTSNCQ